MLRRIAIASFLLLFAGCGSRTLDVNVKLLTQSCPGKDGKTVDALASVSDLEFVVTGDGLDKPMDTTVTVKDGKVTLPGIPLGAKGQVLNRLITVKAHFGSGGPVTAKGAAVVQMSSDEQGPVTIPIFLHPVESFVYTADAGDPSKCTEMNKPRAGHTATLLPDGRVLVVGGAEFDAVGGLTIQDSAELFDPLTGKFTLLGPGQGGPKLARLYQSATLLQDGRVLVAGGEISVDGQLQTARPTEIFDPKTDAFSAGPLLDQGRARHSALLAAGGLVVVAGGYADPGNPLPLKSTEFWDPTKGASTFTVGPNLPQGRSEACATTIRGGQVVVLAGGKTVDGTGKIAATDQIAFLHDVNGAMSLLTDSTGAPLTFQMGQPRYDLGCGTLQVPDGSGGTKDVVALAGGFQTVDQYGGSSVSSAVELFDPASGVSNAGSLSAGARGNLCAVQVDPQTVVFIGGYNSDDDTVATGSEQLSIGSDGTPKIHKTAGAPMNDGRFLHQCTRLADGSILVTGGMLDTPRKAGDPLSLRTAEVYTPLTQ